MAVGHNTYLVFAAQDGQAVLRIRKLFCLLFSGLLFGSFLLVLLDLCTVLCVVNVPALKASNQPGQPVMRTVDSKVKMESLPSEEEYSDRRDHPLFATSILCCRNEVNATMVGIGC